MKLIIAKTNHEVDAAFRKELKAIQDAGGDENQARRNKARKTALKVFGHDAPANDGRLENIKLIDPPVNFAYVDVFENKKDDYKKEAIEILVELKHRIAKPEKQPLARLIDMIPEDHPKRHLFDEMDFGWVAIVDNNQFDYLAEKIGWPDSEFCQMFQIDIVPLQGANHLSDGRLWKIYEEQTPESWGS